MKYEFAAVPFYYLDNPANTWVFISLPKELTQEIRAGHKWQEEGWGRLKIIAQVGVTEWKTSIWFDTKYGTYLLPVKAEIRKKEKVGIGMAVQAAVWI